MKTHEFKTEKGEFVVVDLEDRTYCIPTRNTQYLVSEDSNGLFILPIGLWKLICKLSEVTEEQAKIVVDMYNIGNFNILSYKPSLEYLLTSKGIDINNGNWYLFKKI